jgi:2-polyprenyl-3-methyl-5-hydroxy-6-metoxy-1,4-benzoquinol methylase
MSHDSDLAPFGVTGRLVRLLPSEQLVEMYQRKCGMDVARHFVGIEALALYECGRTGMKYWRPGSVAGDARFYDELSRLWPDYYQTDRWEYEPARAAIGSSVKRVLEVGCGRGYFLRSLETVGHSGLGLELNHQAIVDKVTNLEVRAQDLQSLASTEPESFDVACSFQVLEHVTDPEAFIRGCIRAVRPGGLIILSTPNNEFPLHAEGGDAFDLPPHHLNHFTASTYEQIADHLSLELVDTRTQVERHPRRSVWVDSSHGFLEGGIRQALNAALLATLGARETAGHTLLAVLRKPFDATAAARD